MSAFPLEIMTPKQRFFSGQVESIVVQAPDGELAIWAGHAPMIVALQDGGVRIKQNGTQRRPRFKSGGASCFSAHSQLPISRRMPIGSA
jgi:F0F1-type ATP synthase epsilon subunit